MKQKKIIWEKYVSPITKFYDKNRRKKRSSLLMNSGGIMFEDMAPDKLFNIYDGDTDFLVTNNDFYTIASLKGVEDCKVLTPYKIRVCVAKMFDKDIVLNGIILALNPSMGIHDEIINAYKEIAAGTHNEYVIYEDIYGGINVTTPDKYDITEGFLIFKKQIEKSV